MKKSNIALITALYDAKDANLYREIYFPVIKYAITRMFIESPDNRKYGDVTELQKKVDEWFGITIPLIVLKKSLVALSQTNGDVIISLYDKQNYFSIERVWNADVKNDIDGKAENVRYLFSRLTITFKQYLEHHHLTSTKSFSDLLVEYSNESISLFEKTDASEVIGEEFANMALFLQWLQQNDKDLFGLVEQILWSSIIAGFLARKDVDFETKVEKNVSYYLDSALVFALLDLSSAESYDSVQDMLRIVKEAGCTLKVHPITIREIKNVLAAVEKEQGPRTDSEMASAYVRRKLKLSDILRLRTHLKQILEEDYQVLVSPSVGDAELETYIGKYRNNFKVKELYLQRDSSSDDVFREIHDVFMADFVSAKNSNYGLAEKYDAYFVTTNSDLANFCRPEVKATSVITPGQVVMNLWLHSTQSSNLKLSALTEMISRSIALNQTAVKRKLKTFYSHYSSCMTDKNDWEAMYQSLVYRSNKVLAGLETLADKEREGVATEEALKFAKQVIDIARAEQKRRADAEKKESARNKKLVAELRVITNQLADSRNVQNVSEEQLTALKRLEEQNDEFKKELARRDKEAEIQSRLKEVQDRLGELDRQAQDSVSYCKYWFFIVVETLCSLFILSAIVLAVIHYVRPDFNMGVFGKSKFLSGISGISLIILIFRFKDTYLFSPVISKHKIEKEQLTDWKEHNEEYAKLQKRKAELEKDLDAVRII
ncbi:MAG: hypothetical protein J5823_02490 [Paludibacteraceae bacterium]|nr:hypothetical protein [Paludibacteraceae bacterium]